jgi:hypothetical protein
VHGVLAGFSTARRVKRRQFLRVVATTAVACTVAAGGWTDAFASTSRSSTVTTRDLAALGKDYLAAHPREANKAWLLAQLPGVDATAPVADQLATLLPEIAADFAADRVVAVDGWVIARSDARAVGAIALGA